MIVSNSRHFIFVHIQKCGGTTVACALDKISGWNDVLLGGTPYGEAIQKAYRERFGLHKHSTAREIRKIVGEDVWGEFFKFSFVRHPMSRVVSLYTYVERLCGGRRGARWRRPWSWKSRVLPRWPATRAYLETRDFSGFIRHESFRKALAAKPLEYSLCSEPGGALLVDYVGKLENLDEDFARIAGRIGVEDLRVGRENVSGRLGGLRSYFRSEADIEYIYSLYKGDFDRFGYSVGEVFGEAHSAGA